MDPHHECVNLSTMGNCMAKWWLKKGLKLYQSNRQDEATYQWKRHVIKMSTSTYKFLTYNYLAIVSFNCGNFRDFLSYASNQQMVAEKLNNSQLMCKSFIQMAKANYKLGEYFRCMAYCREALRYEGLTADLEAQIYLMMGDVYYRLGHLERSIMCWNTSLRLAQEQDDVVVESEILTSIGKLHLDFGDILGALNMFKQAYLLLTRSDKHKEHQLMKPSQETTLLYAAILQRLGYSNYSILLIDTVAKEASLGGNRWLGALAMIQKAVALRGSVNDEDVLTVCKISLAMLKEAGDKYNQINANLIISQILTELPSLRHHNFENRLRDAVDIACNASDKISQFVCSHICAEVYEMRGQYSESSWYSNQADTMAREINMLCHVCGCVFGITLGGIEILPCSHIFHTRCIFNDLEKSKKQMQPCRKCNRLYAYNEGFLSLKL